MKKKKMILSLVSAAVLCLFACFAAACGGEEQTEGGSVVSVTLLQNGKPVPDELEIDFSRIRTLGFSVKVEAEGDALKTVRYESSDTGVAQIAPNGTVTLLAEGETTVSAVSAADPSKSDGVLLKVAYPSMTQIRAGGTYRLEAENCDVSEAPYAEPEKILDKNGEETGGIALGGLGNAGTSVVFRFDAFANASVKLRMRVASTVNGGTGSFALDDACEFTLNGVRYISGVAVEGMPDYPAYNGYQTVEFQDKEIFLPAGRNELRVTDLHGGSGAASRMPNIDWIEFEVSGYGQTERPSAESATVVTDGKRYQPNEPFRGARLIVGYGDGGTETVEVTEDMLEGFTTAVGGRHTVLVRYKDIEAKFFIVVDAPKPVTEAGVYLLEGEDADYSGAPNAVPEAILDENGEETGETALAGLGYTGSSVVFRVMLERPMKMHMYLRAASTAGGGTGAYRLDDACEITVNGARFLTGATVRSLNYLPPFNGYHTIDLCEGNLIEVAAGLVEIRFTDLHGVSSADAARTPNIDYLTLIFLE